MGTNLEFQVIGVLYNLQSFRNGKNSVILCGSNKYPSVLWDFILETRKSQIKSGDELSDMFCQNKY